MTGERMADLLFSLNRRKARNLNAVIYESVLCLWLPLIFINICILHFLFCCGLQYLENQPFLYKSLTIACGQPGYLLLKLPLLWCFASLCVLQACFHESNKRLRLNLFSCFTAQTMPFPSCQYSVITKLHIFFIYVDIFRSYFQGSVKVHLRNPVLFFFCFFSCSSHSVKVRYTFLAPIF